MVVVVFFDLFHAVVRHYGSNDRLGRGSGKLSHHAAHVFFAEVVILYASGHFLSFGKVFDQDENAGSSPVQSMNRSHVSGEWENGFVNFILLHLIPLNSTF